jgi:hypothetical protein
MNSFPFKNFIYLEFVTDFKVMCDSTQGSKITVYLFTGTRNLVGEGTWTSIEIKIKAIIVHNPTTGIHPPFDDATIVLNLSSHCSHFERLLTGSPPHSPIIIQNY